jgi:hypothetical protein
MGTSLSQDWADAIQNMKRTQHLQSGGSFVAQVLA